MVQSTCYQAARPWGWGWVFLFHQWGVMRTFIVQKGYPYQGIPQDYGLPPWAYLYRRSFAVLLPLSYAFWIRGGLCSIHLQNADACRNIRPLSCSGNVPGVSPLDHP